MSYEDQITIGQAIHRDSNEVCLSLTGKPITYFFDLMVLGMYCSIHSREIDHDQEDLDYVESNIALAKRFNVDTGFGVCDEVTDVYEAIRNYNRLLVACGMKPSVVGTTSRLTSELTEFYLMFERDIQTPHAKLARRNFGLLLASAFDPPEYRIAFFQMLSKPLGEDVSSGDTDFDFKTFFASEFYREQFDFNKPGKVTRYTQRYSQDADTYLVTIVDKRFGLMSHSVYTFLDVKVKDPTFDIELL